MFVLLFFVPFMIGTCHHKIMIGVDLVLVLWTPWSTWQPNFNQLQIKIQLKIEKIKSWPLRWQLNFSCHILMVWIFLSHLNFDRHMYWDPNQAIILVLENYVIIKFWSSLGWKSYLYKTILFWPRLTLT